MVKFYIFHIPNKIEANFKLINLMKECNSYLCKIISKFLLIVIVLH